LEERKMYASYRSQTSFKLYIVAAVLMFIQSILAFTMTQQFFPTTISAVIGILFLVGAAMAKIGFGIAARTQRSAGGGYVVSSVETADACICGVMTGLAVLILASVQIVQAINGGTPQNIPIAIPGVLGGLVAMAAGVVAFNQARKQGTFGPPPVHAEVVTPAAPIPEDSVTCPYCSKKGISPHAQNCPNCGQPLT
jgi:xanthine/uracil permease